MPRPVICIIKFYTNINRSFPYTENIAGKSRKQIIFDAWILRVDKSGFFDDNGPTDLFSQKITCCIDQADPGDCHTSARS